MPPVTLIPKFAASANANVIYSVDSMAVDAVAPWYALSSSRKKAVPFGVVPVPAVAVTIL